MAAGRPSRATVYARLEEAITDLNQRLGGLPSPVEAEDIWDDLWHQEAHHSTALEGNTLILAEVRKLLDEGRAVGAKELREYMEVVGYAEAARWVYGQALEPGTWTTGDLLSMHEVRSVHHLSMTPVWGVAPHPHAAPEEGPVNWRRHEIAAFAEGMKPPPFTDLDHLMRDWVTEVNTLRDTTDEPLPERLARLHNAFEQIHPFLDGNGRAGRLLLNLILVRLGYPPAIVFKNERTRYLTAMRKADIGDVGPLGELIARSVTGNLYRFVVPAVAGPARLVPLASLVDKNAGLTHDALRVAAIRGRLRAQKTSDGTWLSSKKWVSDYQTSRYRRAPKAAPHR
jgi:fido (protein-threonine AMPylation protein)